MPNVLIDGELILYGIVGEADFGSGFTATEVVEALAVLGRSKSVTVRINSPGGFVTEGIAIYNALKAHRGRVTVIVDAIAASAASMIAMAGDDVAMRRGSLMMIHDPAGLTIGDAAEHQKAIISLDLLGDSMADIYAQKTGRSAKELRDDMRAERWLTAEEAVAAKFADRLDSANSNDPVAFDYRRFKNAPERFVAMADARAWSKPAPRIDVKPSASMLKLCGLPVPSGPHAATDTGQGYGYTGSRDARAGAGRATSAQPRSASPRSHSAAGGAPRGLPAPSASMLELVEGMRLAAEFGGADGAGANGLPPPSASMLKLLRQPDDG